MNTLEDAGIGASPSAIQSHYDVDTQFYRLWLDASMTYSAALWDPADRSLEEAQNRKLAFALQRAGLAPGGSLLDVGCGWGSVLRLATSEMHCDRAIGLTLSPAQASYVQAQRWPRSEVRIESWSDHAPAARYDAITCIGAFEHFARPGLTSSAKVEGYRHFFVRCHELLRRGGRMFLQTIAYGPSSEAGLTTAVEDIFPESDVPHLEEIQEAAQGNFRIVEVLHHGDHYKRTLHEWERRLRSSAEAATTLVGADQVARYRRYLQISRLGFHLGRSDLLRLTLESTDQ